LNAANSAGTILAMLSNGSGNQSGDDNNDPFSNLKLSSEFEKRVKDWNISDNEVLNVLKNGKKFTDEEGRFIIWDPKSKLLISVDKVDGELITIYKRDRPSREWLPGWFEDSGD
jgi:hypothetical protein